MAASPVASPPVSPVAERPNPALTQLARPTVGTAAIDVPIHKRKGHNVDHPYGKG